MYPPGFKPDDDQPDLSGFTPDEPSTPPTQPAPKTQFPSFQLPQTGVLQLDKANLGRVPPQPSVFGPRPDNRSFVDQVMQGSAKQVVPLAGSEEMDKAVEQLAKDNPQVYGPMARTALGAARFPTSRLGVGLGLAAGAAPFIPGGVAAMGATTVGMGTGMFGSGAYKAYQNKEPGDITQGLLDMGMGALALYGGVRGFREGMTPQARTGFNPETPPRTVEEINKSMVEARQRADQIVRNPTSEPLLSPEQIPIARQRYNELMQKGESGSITQPEIIEGLQLERKLRAVNFGETGTKPAATTQPVPTGEPVKVPPVLDPQAQAVRDQTAPFDPSTLKFGEKPTGPAPDLPLNPPQEAQPAAQPAQPPSLSPSQARIERARRYAGGDEEYAQGLAKAAGIKASVLKKAQAATNLRPEPGERTVAFQKRARIPMSQAEALVRDARDQVIRAQHYPSTGIPEGANIPGSPEIRGGIRQPAQEYPGYKGEISNEQSVASEATPEDIAAAQQRSAPAADFNSWLKDLIKGESGEFNPAALEKLRALFEKQKTTPLTPEELADAKSLAQQPEGFTPDEDGEHIPPTPEEIPKQRPDKSGPLQSLWDLPRGLMSVDLPFATSAAFRQGAGYAWTGRWFKAFADSARAFSSKETADLIQAKIEEKPLFKPIEDPTTGELKPSYAKRMGLRMGDLGSYSQRDESIRGELAERIPIYGKYVAANNRAFTAMMNSLSSSTFEMQINNAVKLAKTPEQNPMMNEVLGKDMAEAVNTTLKRGKLGFEVGPYEVSMEKNARLLANVFFSPRNIASEVRMLNPSTYIMASPQARQIYVAAVARRVTSWAVLATAASAMGAKVSLDPTNSDFGKIRIGNTRIDPPGGLSQFIVLAARLKAGGETSSNTNRFTRYGSGFPPQTRTGQVVDFGLARLHPSLGYLKDLGMATSKKPIGLGDKTLQLAAPMFADDLVSVDKKHPELALGVSILSSAGMGVQTYDRNSFSKPKFISPKNDIMIGRR